jgi:proteasome accessory factor C
MAERRPITARDVKSHVEGYSEMSDEAFARRFYSDRAELLGLGVPLESQRDEFTGEELYTLRSEQYFLPPLELKDEELAALQTSLYMLEGSFAYAEPLRLALQNLTLGRPGFRHAPTPTAERVEVLDPDYSPEMAGRLSKLEGAISKGRTVRFEYWNPSRDETRERTVNPYALLREARGWYVVARDLEGDATKTWKVSRIRGEIRFATRRERDFRIPAGFDVESERLPPDWQIPRPATGTARIRVAPETAWWVERLYGDYGRLEGDVFVTEYADLNRLAGWILRQDGRAEPLEPRELRDEVARALELIAERHAGPPPDPAPAADRLATDGAPERLGGPVAPERFAILQALLAYLLAACGENSNAEVDARELLERFHIPPDGLEEYLSLLNLVNFGGGCYTVYAQLDGDTVRVTKEMYGDTFRAPPRLTPLEARAIRLALEFVGATIAANARSPLERVRAKLEETFGQFDLPQTPEPHVVAGEEDLVATLSEGIRERRVVELDYLKEEEQEPSRHLVEPYSLERRLPHWYVHTWDRTRDAERSFRLDRMRRARVTDERFESRPGFEPQWLRGARTVRVWYAQAVARWQVERGAVPLADGAALADLAVGHADWLVSEIFSACGEAVVVEPGDLREQVGKRATALARELGLAKTASRR